MTEREESVLRNRKMVQRTNDFATGWKAALVNFGWFDDPFLKQISSQEFQSSFEKQRATLWIMKVMYQRLVSLNHILKTFLEETDYKGQIISLGAGFDTAYFRLKASSKKDIKFVEVDLPDLVLRKIAIIEGNHSMKSLLKNYSLAHQVEVPYLKSADYNLIGFNLERVTELMPILLDCGIAPDQPTLIVTEFVLPYLNKDSQSKLIKWTADSFPHSVHISHGPTFASEEITKALIDTHAKHGSSWTVESQSYGEVAETFMKQGWQTSYACGLLSYYCKIAGKIERGNFRKLTFFDKHEVATAAAQILFLCCSANGTLFNFSKKLHFDQIPHKNREFANSMHALASKIALKHVQDSDELVSRYGYSSVVLKHGCYLMFGGYGSTHRIGDSLVKVSMIGNQGPQVICEFEECQTTGNKPGKLAYCSLVQLEGSESVLFGGYDESCIENNDIYILKNLDAESPKYQWLKPMTSGSIPQARWRHSAEIIKHESGNPSMILFGGRNNDHFALGDCYKLSLTNLQWHKCNMLGDVVQASHSHSSVVWNNSMLIYGGLNSEDVAINSLYQISLEDKIENTVRFKLIRTDPELPASFSSSCVIQGDNLFIVGGVKWTPGMPDIFLIDLQSGKTSSYKVDLSLISERLLFFGITCDVVDKTSDEQGEIVAIAVLGGGGYIMDLNNYESVFTQPTLLRLKL